MLGNKKQQGITLYLSLMVMTMLLSMALGLSTIFLVQTKIIRGMGNSAIALCAADAGIEEVLINRQAPFNIPETVLSNGATYQVIVTVGGVGDCSISNYYCIKSVGSYLGTKRAIEINY